MINYLFCLFLCFLFLPFSVRAQGVEIDPALIEEVSANLSERLPQVKLTPDSPLYFVKGFQETVALAMKRRVEEEVNYRRQIAESRLAEALKMIEKNRLDLAGKLLNSFQDQMEMIQAELSSGTLAEETLKLEENRLSEVWVKYKATLQQMPLEETKPAVETTSSSVLVKESEQENLGESDESRLPSFLKVLGVSRVSSSDDFQLPFRSPISLRKGGQ